MASFTACTRTWRWTEKSWRARAGTLIDWHISRFRVMYARSANGLNWEKPAMGIVREGGHDTNIVFGSETYGNVWGPAVLDDPLETDPGTSLQDAV